MRAAVPFGNCCPFAAAGRSAPAINRAAAAIAEGKRFGEKEPALRGEASPRRGTGIGVVILMNRYAVKDSVQRSGKVSAASECGAPEPPCGKASDNGGSYAGPKRSVAGNTGRSKKEQKKQKEKRRIRNACVAGRANARRCAGIRQEGVPSSDPPPAATADTAPSSPATARSVPIAPKGPDRQRRRLSEEAPAGLFR